MKKRLFIPALLLSMLLCGAPLSYAAADEDTASIEAVQQETQALIAALKDYGANERDKAMQQAEQAMKRLDQRIDALQSRVDRHWTEMSAAAQKSAREDLKTLRQQRILLAERYGSWKSSSASAWEHMKHGFANAYQAMQDAWEKAEREYQRSE